MAPDKCCGVNSAKLNRLESQFWQLKAPQDACKGSRLGQALEESIEPQIARNKAS